MAFPSGDAALQEHGAPAFGLHLRVVIALQCNAVKVAKAVIEVTGDMAEVGGVADAIAVAVDDKAVRAKMIMREGYRVASKPLNR